MFAYFGADHSASAIVSFQPTILRQLGYTASAAQIHTIPVFLTAFVLSIAAAALSDRLRHRYAFALAGILLACIGWSLQLAQANPVGARYFGLFAITAGTYVLMPVLVVWNINNLGVGYKRVIGSAFQIGGGNCAALVSSNVFIAREAPKYGTGFGVAFAMNALAGVCCTVLFWGLRRENRRRDRRGEGDGVGEVRGRMENLGDGHPSFRYTL
ncbi:MAG: hypothetical protein Q9202_005703 [Teloschistes flavicans]